MMMVLVGRQEREKMKRINCFFRQGVLYLTLSFSAKTVVVSRL